MGQSAERHSSRNRSATGAPGSCGGDVISPVISETSAVSWPCVVDWTGGSIFHEDWGATLRGPDGRTSRPHGRRAVGFLGRRHLGTFNVLTGHNYNVLNTAQHL